MLQATLPQGKQCPVLLNAAREYRALGWSVIPVAGKSPLGSWKRYQSAHAGEETLEQMFSAQNVTGLAVILGAISGGLAVRDFDKASSYCAWADSHPTEAESLPTVETARGFHVYGRLDNEQFYNFGDGELRADSRHYVVLPPSIHPDGATYRWLNPLRAGELPILPSSLLEAYPDSAGHTQADSQDPGTQNSLGSLSGSQTVHKQVEDLIVSTLPTGRGQRRDKLFELARILRASNPDASPADLRFLLRHWHAKALPVIGTKPFSETWTDFVACWGSVKQPKGHSFDAAVAAVEAGGIPPVCQDLGYDGELRQLTALCFQLQLQHGDKPFPLGCEKAGQFVGASKSEGHRLLKALQFDGVIRLHTKGNKTTRKASEYLFIAG